MSELQTYQIKKQNTMVLISNSGNVLAIELMLTRRTILNKDKNVQEYRTSPHAKTFHTTKQTINWIETHLLKDLFKAINEHFRVLELVYHTFNQQPKELQDALDFLTKLTRNDIRQATTNALKIE
jgi:frataxin-like iron-binding protein CyaY